MMCGKVHFFIRKKPECFRNRKKLKKDISIKVCRVNKFVYLWCKSKLRSMEAKHLRIGNKCQWNKFASMGRGELYINIGALSYANFIDPIPITEGRLVEFGFVIGVDSDGDKYASLQTKCGTLQSDYSINFSYVSIRINHEEVKVGYVHQLQNLYFALAGKELKFKEAK